MTEWRLITANDVRQFEPGADWHAAEAVRRIPPSTYEHGNPDAKIPRNHVPRSYRLTLGSRLMAAVRVRHMKDLNYLQVQNFFHEESQEIVEECLAFLFTESTRCSGQTEIRFVRGKAADAHPVPVPAPIVEYASAHGVSLPAPESGVIASETGLTLWLETTGLSALSRQKLEALRKMVSPARVCFLLGQGVWSRVELDAILSSAPFPELVLTGEAEAEDRVLQSVAHQAGRSAVLAGNCTRFLTHQYTASEGAIERIVSAQASYAPATGALIVRALPDRRIQMTGWLLGGELSPAESAAIAVRSRPAAGIERAWREDLAAAGQSRADTAAAQAGVVYPRDVRWLPREVLAEMTQAAREKGLAILAAPDSMDQMQQEVRRRLRLAKLVRS